MKNNKKCLLKGISLILIPLFLMSNFASAKAYGTATNTLARYSFVQCATAEGAEFDKLSSKLAQAWVAGITAKVTGSEGAITLSDAEIELIKQIGLWSQAGNVSEAQQDKIIAALRYELAKQSPITFDPPIKGHRLAPDLIVSYIVSYMEGKEYTRLQQFETVRGLLSSRQLANHADLAVTLNTLRHLIDESSPDKINDAIDANNDFILVKDIIRLAFFTPGEGSGKRKDTKTGNAKTAKLIRDLYTPWKDDNYVRDGEIRIETVNESAQKSNKSGRDWWTTIVFEQYDFKTKNWKEIGRNSNFPWDTRAKLQYDHMHQRMDVLIKEPKRDRAYLDTVPNARRPISEKEEELIVKRLRLNTLINHLNQVGHYNGITKDIATAIEFARTLIPILTPEQQVEIFQALAQSMKKYNVRIAKARENLRVLFNKLPAKNKTAKLSRLLTEVLPAQTVISDVERLTNEINTHQFLGVQSPIDLSETVIVMKKNLPDVFSSGKKSIIGTTLKQGYQHMTQELRKLFRNGEGVIEVENETEIPKTVDSLTGQGLKVIVLGDDTLAEIPWKDSITNGKRGEDYCVISAATQKQGLDAQTIHYINLNAMAFMGAGMLNHDEILFTTAYNLFTGQNPPEGTMEHFRLNELWHISLLPRVVKLIGSLADRETLRKLFTVSA